jgi:AcrR family transcriptional regulator
MSPTNSPGLRERKKQKTKWSIQEQALRLFQEQGYDQTTVDQIAAAAEISPSTFFRYFKTKEDVVLQDEYDPLVERLFAAAPPDLPLIPALRHALRQAMSRLGEAELRKMQQRIDLMMAVPALRMRLVDNMIGSIDAIAAGAAARAGRPADDFGMHAFAGACIGALLAAFFVWLKGDRTDDLIELTDRALAELEAAVEG